MEQLKDCLATLWLWFLGCVLAAGVVLCAWEGPILIRTDREIRYTVLAFVVVYLFFVFTRWSVNRVDPSDDPCFSVANLPEPVESRPVPPPPPPQPARQPCSEK